jgi:hypothetical protein
MHGSQRPAGIREHGALDLLYINKEGMKLQPQQPTFHLSVKNPRQSVACVTESLVARVRNNLSATVGRNEVEAHPKQAHAQEDQLPSDKHTCRCMQR